MAGGPHRHALVTAFAALAMLAAATHRAAAARDVVTEEITVPREVAPLILPGVDGAAPDMEEAGPAVEEATPDGEEATPSIEEAVPQPGPIPAETDPAELPVVEYDAAKLPAPVRRLREQLIEIARSGDIDALRPVIEANPFPPTFTFGDDGTDPVDFLKSQSGDGEGREVLAILQEVLEAGYVHVDTGTDQEMYIWPYFARYRLDALDGRQMVELFRLVTAGDYQDMQAFGAYIFYRVGIAPDGSWAYFVAGD